MSYYYVKTPYLTPTRTIGEEIYKRYPGSLELSHRVIQSGNIFLFGDENSSYTGVYLFSVKNLTKEKDRGVISGEGNVGTLFGVKSDNKNLDKKAFEQAVEEVREALGPKKKEPDSDDNPHFNPWNKPSY